MNDPRTCQHQFVMQRLLRYTGEEDFVIMGRYCQHCGWWEKKAGSEGPWNYAGFRHQGYPATRGGEAVAPAEADPF